MPHVSYFFLLILIGLLQVGHTQPVPILSHPKEVQPIPLHLLNSPYREANLSISPNGQYLFFMSGRGGQSWSKKGGYRFQGKEEFDGDIWRSDRNHQEWQAPEVLNEGVNSAQGEDEPSISPDGNRVIFQSWRMSWMKDGGPYYEASLEGNQWGTPEGLGSGIHQFFLRKRFATDGMSVSPDGSYAIVACGPEYDGNMDFYLSKRAEDDSWTYPKPLSINTRGDERSVFIAGDSRTLYLASSGHGGMGGLDIFKTTLQADGSLGKLINLGPPFNTEADDYGLIITANGNEAYFVRDGDIYFADLRRADPRIRPGATLMIGGKITSESGQSLGTDIQLRELSSQKVLSKTRSNSRSGEYALAIPYRPGPFQLVIEADGYESGVVDISADRIAKASELRLNVPLTPLPKSRGATPSPPPASPAPEEPFILEFDYDSPQVQKKYEHILQGLARLQQKYPDLQLLISGHTDGDGNDAYNLELSRRRVMAVASSLVRDGAEEARLVSDFCGEAKPIASNESPLGKALNRRVEIRILRKEE